MWTERYGTETRKYINKLGICEFQIYQYGKKNNMDFDLALYSLLADLEERKD